MAEQDQVEAVAAGDEDCEDSPNYKPPAPKSLDDIVKQDADDESLRKYKEMLLGPGAGETIVIDPNVKEKVIIKKLAIAVEGRDDMEIDLTQPLSEIKKRKIVMKEGCKYQVKIFFYVQREIVSGLKYKRKVYKSGIPVAVDKFTHMVGSYSPKKEIYVYITPPDDAPSGMLARGDYKIDNVFVDDDGFKYLSWEWCLSIKKEFE